MEKRSAVGLQELLSRSKGFFSFLHRAFEFEFLTGMTETFRKYLSTVCEMWPELVGLLLPLSIGYLIFSLLVSSDTLISLSETHYRTNMHLFLLYLFE